MYALDTNEARKADTNGNQIKELGKYVGQFTQAVDIKTKKGGAGVSFAFQSSSGQKANLAIYTASAEGERYGGYATLMAIMTCMGLRNIAPKPGTFLRYDYDTKKEVKESGSVFAELCKPIGVLLETEDYEKQDGSIGTRMVLKGAFQASTELTASEILDRKTVPEALQKMVSALRHRPIKQAQQMPSRTHGGHMPDDQFFGDDAPF